MRNLSVEWFHNIPDEKRKIAENSIRSSTILVTQILRILDRWEEELNASESKLSDYDTPSWEAKQAHRNGDRARIRKLRELFSFNQ